MVVQALSAIHELKSGMRVIVDVEQEYDDSQNNVQRIRRKHFYLKNNYVPTEVEFNWSGDNFIIMAFGGNVTEQEFDDLWLTVEHNNNIPSEYL